MATMNISLPDALRDFVDQEVEQGGYAGVSDYVRELLRERKAKAELEAKLLSALESPTDGEFTAEFFEEVRDGIRRRRDAAAKGGK
jgi:antitoxin ParD1/3/4